MLKICWDQKTMKNKIIVKKIINDDIFCGEKFKSIKETLVNKQKL